MHARIGMAVDSLDGPWGELDDFVVDPITWHLTHLVVQPHHHHDRSHLVEIADITACDERITLGLSSDDIETTPKVEVTEFVKIDRPDNFGNGWTVGAGAVSAWPYYPSVGAAAGVGGGLYTSGGSRAYGDSPRYVATKFDHVPDNEVEIRRSSHVVSSDHEEVGKVDGFVFAEDGSITHLVLEHGHLWAHREVTVPMAHVRSGNRDRVSLDLTRRQIGELPSIKFRRISRAAASR